MKALRKKLRTPVAILCGETEVALAKEDRTQEEYREALQILAGESKRLKRIVEDLLTTAGVGSVDDDEFTDEIDDRMMMDPTSPSVVRKVAGFEDESF